MLTLDLNLIFPLPNRMLANEGENRFRILCLLAIYMIRLAHSCFLLYTVRTGPKSPHQQDHVSDPCQLSRPTGHPVDSGVTIKYNCFKIPSFWNGLLWVIVVVSNECNNQWIIDIMHLETKRISFPLSLQDHKLCTAKILLFMIEDLQKALSDSTCLSKEVCISKVIS
jgi:hypothetical protein